MLNLPLHNKCFLLKISSVNFQRILSHLLKKSLMENFNCCTVHCQFKKLLPFKWLIIKSQNFSRVTSSWGLGQRMSINNICACKDMWYQSQGKCCAIKKIVTFEQPIGNGWNLVRIQMFMRGFSNNLNQFYSVISSKLLPQKQPNVSGNLTAPYLLSTHLYDYQTFKLLDLNESFPNDLNKLHNVYGSKNHA